MIWALGPRRTASRSTLCDMANDRRGAAALAVLTARMTDDREGYDAVIAEFEGGPAEALAAMMRITEMLIKMLAQTQDISPLEMLQQVGVAMAEYDVGEAQDES